MSDQPRIMRKSDRVKQQKPLVSAEKSVINQTKYRPKKDPSTKQYKQSQAHKRRNAFRRCAKIEARRQKGLI